MAIERRNPVPPGRYYVFMGLDDTEAWDEWTRAHAAAVRVLVVEAQTVTPSSPVFATTPTGDVIKDTVGFWVLFDVLSPVPWVNIGLPTIVTDPRVRSTRDVYQYPEPSGEAGPLDQLYDGVQSLITLATLGGAALVIATVARGFTRSKP